MDRINRPRAEGEPFGASKVHCVNLQRQWTFLEKIHLSYKITMSGIITYQIVIKSST